jgi:hypothetical protein
MAGEFYESDFSDGEAIIAKAFVLQSPFLYESDFSDGEVIVQKPFVATPPFLYESDLTAPWLIVGTGESKQFSPDNNHYVSVPKSFSDVISFNASAGPLVYLTVTNNGRRQHSTAATIVLQSVSGV